MESRKREGSPTLRSVEKWSEFFFLLSSFALLSLLSLTSSRMTLRGPKLDSDIDETPPKAARAQEEAEPDTRQRGRSR